MKKKPQKKSVLSRVIRTLGILSLVYMVAFGIQFLIPKAPTSLFGDRVPSRPLTIAHRGGALLWPENTIYAFGNALDIGADVFEMDLFITSDGIPVVIHDDTVDRTTNGSGRISDFSLTQLQALDAGYRFNSIDSSNQFPYRGQGIRIPTLQEVFERFPSTPMIIEIKKDDPTLIRKTGELIQQYNRESLSKVGSFSTKILNDFRTQFPEIETGAGSNEVTIFYVLHRLFLSGYVIPVATGFQVPEFQGPLHVANRRFIADAQRKGLRVDAWTINDEVTMNRLLDIGIDGLITDRPDLAQRIIQQRFPD
jgi:glycerophosphoryl diester phosphodiesterase